LIIIIDFSIFFFLKYHKAHVNYSKLISASRKARLNAHAPYSKFRVGAAVLTSGGKIITGCNIEISSFSLTICAERTALFKALSENHRKFRALSIATDLAEYIPPCGACRQVIYELAGDIDIILCPVRGREKIFKLSNLLPFPFHKKTFLDD
jgi:cytidine deaminase